MFKMDVSDGLRLTIKQNGGPAYCPIQELKIITKLHDNMRKKTETDHTHRKLRHQT